MNKLWVRVKVQLRRKDEGQEDELRSFCSCPCEGMGLNNDPSYVTKEKGVVFMRYLKQARFGCPKREQVAGTSN